MNTTTDTTKTCATDGCTNVIQLTGKRGRPVTKCPDCRDNRQRAKSGNSAPWRLDDDMLAAAVKHFGLVRPVYVRRSKGVRLLGAYKGTRLGCQLNAAAEPVTTYHYITVSARLTDDQASRVLWHELTHAAQAERDPLFHKKYQTALRDSRAKSTQRSGAAHARYESLPWEVEARKNEGLHDTVGSLTLPNTGWTLPVWRKNPRIMVGTTNGVAVGGDLFRITADAPERVTAAQKAWTEEAQATLAAIEAIRKPNTVPVPHPMTMVG